MTVNAVVSGQAGVALLVDGEKLSSIHAGRSGEIVRRNLAEARFLLGNAGDLQFLENIELDEVIRRLELASTQMDAFHTALILLDGSLPSETRQVAAEELQDFLEDETLAHFIESVLFSHPLTPDSDLPGALAVCTPQTGKTRSFLDRLASLQEAIAEVHLAWERIPTAIFGTDADRKRALSTAVREGLFRSLVLFRASGSSVRAYLAEAPLKSQVRQAVLCAWSALLNVPEVAGGALARYGIDLVAQARHGELDPVIGRDDEIQRVIQILSRRTKNNPVLIGEPGVGKTAIVEGVAQSIVRGAVPAWLEGCSIFSLDLGALLAGVRHGDEVQERLKAVLHEVKQSDRRILLFIPEIHTLLGTGKTEDGTDVGSLLRPMLGRNELSCIGATTLDQYREHIEKNAALNRRFQPVLVDPPSVEETVSILRGLRESFEAHHRVRIRDSALIAAAVLSNRYITDRVLPAKAIDLIDEASITLREEVTEDEVLEVVSRWTDVPVARLVEGERERLLRMEELLRQRVVGQDEAVKLVVDAVIRGRAGLKGSQRPVGSFLFVGPVGVGKNEVAKTLAQALFDSEENLVRIEMSEYMERHTISRLIEAGGQLIEAVRRKVYAVVLLEGIEQAHSDVLSVLLEILDNGSLTDSLGRTADFKNTVLVLTSNVGSHLLEWVAPSGEIEDSVRHAILRELRDRFQPELLNRVDDLVLFKPLTLSEIKRIIDLQIGDLRRRLSGRGLILELTEPARELIAREGYDPVYGARLLKRYIQHRLESQIARSLISSQIKAGSVVRVDVRGGSLAVDIEAPRKTRITAVDSLKVRPS